MRGSLPTPGLVVGARVIDCVSLTGGRNSTRVLLLGKRWGRFGVFWGVSCLLQDAVAWCVLRMTIQSLKLCCTSVPNVQQPFVSPNTLQEPKVTNQNSKKDG